MTHGKKEEKKIQKNLLRQQNERLNLPPNGIPFSMHTFVIVSLQ